MTCIVGITHDGKVTIGADAAGIDGSLNLVTRRDEKVFAKDGFVIGYTSSFRMGQLLRYSLVIPKRHPETDLFEYLVTDYVQAVRETFRYGGFSQQDQNVDTGGEFLIGTQGRLFRMFSDFHIAENVYGYDACGCGEHYAMAAMRVLFNVNPQERLTQALETAAEFSAGVRGPFTFLSI